jgi:DNA invertase Pin-like site-specific DNA recombinase
MPPARPTASGAKTDRAALAKVLARLDQSDVLLVTRLDRLARSTRDLLNTLDAIAKRGAAFKSLPTPGRTPRHRTAS